MLDMLSVPPARTRLGLAQPDGARRAEHRLQPRAAGLLTVNAGRSCGTPLREGDLAGGVGTAARLPGVPEHYLVDALRRQRRPRERFPCGGGAEVGGGERRQRTTEAADRRPYRRRQDQALMVRSHVSLERLHRTLTTARGAVIPAGRRRNEPTPRLLPPGAGPALAGQAPRNFGLRFST